MTRARAELVAAIRKAAGDGMTQAQIALQTGRSQPEISRLLRFHGTSALARRLRQHASQIKQVLAAVGGTNLRVFGSVATGGDKEGSDIDLLFTMGSPLSLMEIAATEHRMAEILGVDVDLVPDVSLRPDLRSRIMSEAVAL